MEPTSSVQLYHHWTTKQSFLFFLFFSSKIILENLEKIFIFIFYFFAGFFSFILYAFHGFHTFLLIHHIVICIERLYIDRCILYFAFEELPSFEYYLVWINTRYWYIIQFSNKELSRSFLPSSIINTVFFNNCLVDKENNSFDMLWWFHHRYFESKKKSTDSIFNPYKLIYMCVVCSLCQMCACVYVSLLSL
jgi:hypothetical protein